MPQKEMEEIDTHEAYSLAKAIAQKIVSGELSEQAGATEIWKMAVNKLKHSCPDDLWVFKSNASAIEDIQWNAEHGGDTFEAVKRQLEQEILSAAKQLTRQA